MQHSSMSYRSNYANQSRRNYNTASVMQQQQIEELEQKVDLILLHNNQLIQENMKLKSMLEMASVRETSNKYKSSDGSEIYHLKRQLQIKCLQLEQLAKQSILYKQSVQLQINDLNEAIKNITKSRQLILFQKQEIQRKLSSINQERNSQISHLRHELQNQIYQTSLKKQIQHKQQMRSKQAQLNKILEKKSQQWNDEKMQIQQQKMNAIVKMQQKMEKQKTQVRKQLQEQLKKNLEKAQGQADQKCRKIREQSENYIKIMVDKHRSQQQGPNQDLKKQIQGLRQSLEERQKIIENLLKFQIQPSAQNSYYKQVQELRTRIKELTEAFFKQSELLKVKMATKHQIDIQEMIKVYENKIDILTSRITVLEGDKLRLRQNYQDQIKSKMKQRQKFEIQVSKLKNYIRKMKIELESYGKQMRLNIQGIRDQANSFSMSILGQLGQEKNKKNFYQEQIRKMRQVVELKEREMQTNLKQGQQKIKYYEEKLKLNKKVIDDLTQQLEKKEEKYREQIDDVKQNAKEEQKRQKQHLQSQVEDLKRQLIDLKKFSEKLQQNLKQTQLDKKAVQKQLQKINHELEDCKAHIDQLKIQIQMMGQNQANQERNALKQHYERVIQQLEQDKKMLKQANTAQQEQLSKLVSKYKVLQKSMQKTLSTMKKKTQLQKKVINLGMDNNLVKNLAQVFQMNQDPKQNN